MYDSVDSSTETFLLVGMVDVEIFIVLWLRLVLHLKIYGDICPIEGFEISTGSLIQHNMKPYADNISSDSYSYCMPKMTRERTSNDPKNKAVRTRKW